MSQFGFNKRFGRNRRAVWSLRVLMVLVVVSVFAPWIANDRPWVVCAHKQFYFPVLKNYPEVAFGGYFKTPMNYRGVFFKSLMDEPGSWAIWPPVRFNFDTHNFQLTEPAPSPPSLENWLGTDDQGRDILANLIYGLRISLWFGLLLTVSASLLGVALGACQGYFGGGFDLVGQRILEVWSGLPSLYIIMILSSLVRPSFWTLLLVMLLFSWPGLVGRVRAECLRERNLDYVKAAQVMGLKSSRIIFKHVLPNALVTTLTLLPFLLTENIVALSSLDFLGFGMPIGSPSLGLLLAQAKDNLHAPWIGISVFFTLSILLSILIFIGEGLRDAMDPRLKHVC